MTKQELLTLSPAKFAKLRWENQWTKEQADRMWSWYFANKRTVVDQALEIFPGSKLVETG